MSAVLDGIYKRFGDLQALRGASLEVVEGEVHALVGANGSGKSTLAKCLSGVHRPDAGTIRLGGTTVEGFSAPVEAAAAGVRIVHQDSPLILSLKVEENFALAQGYPAMSPVGRISWRRLRGHVTEALERFDVPVRPDVLAATLTPAESAMVSLAMTLYDLDERRVEVLVLDEVTPHIPEAEANEVLERVRKLPNIGVPVLMVTHRFKEVLEFADNATVLADGDVVYAGSTSELDIPRLVEFMTSTGATQSGQRQHGHHNGEDAAGEAVSLEGLAELWRRTDLSEGQAAALDVEGIRDGGLLTDVTFSIRRGEVVGVAGLPDSGIDELPEILSGISPRVGGRIAVAGRELPESPTPAEAIALGIGLAPRDRHQEGGVMTLSVQENITLPVARRYWHHKAAETRTVERFIDAFDIRPPLPKALMGTLSGGNQQKVVIAKWMHTRPRILILDDPTAGVDPGARLQLFRILADSAEQGLTVLIFTSEPEQLAEHCSRVLVVAGGRIVEELSGDSLAAETINQKVAIASHEQDR